MENQTQQLTPQELALVLGCEAETKQKNFLYVNYPPQKQIITGILLADISGYEYIKPFLRKLEDLSEEECEMYNCILEKMYHLNKIQDQMISHAKATAYLLSKHFDLFDWILTGKALHRTQ